ncbi:MAG TPA: single-stranded-DNA-specific exonuclease RecJ [Spirochaetia bacterium]|nr:single-stranded-DNA-specific exonuclease RecJ [Spirochaetia bacterium]
MTWNKSPLDSAAVKEMARRYGLDLLPAAILSRRGITSPEALLYFVESDLGFLHNPFLMPAMADAVERINAAIESGEKILIFGDRDVDGITATVLLFEALAGLGAEVQWMLPEGEDSYGLSPRAIDKAQADGVGLLVTVDCGVSNIQEIALAADKGIDTVVVDHHNPPPDLPPAVAVVNPKLPGYPFRDLCGCAVASKLEWALRFSRSPFFGISMCLFNARPMNEAIRLEAIRMTNLVETSRMQENIIPGLIPFEKSRFADFASRDEVLVLDAPTQVRLLQKAFGPDVSVSLSDLAPLLSQFLPGRAGRSLLGIQQESRAARYSSGTLSEIDTLAESFRALVLAREEARLAPWRERLDLVTLGTLADLMPLADENRILVRCGIAALRAPERGGLRQLFKRKDLLGKRVGTTEIAWQIAPLLNSAGRMGEPGAATKLLLSAAADGEEPLVDQLFALDSQRRAMGEATWSLVLGPAKDSLERSGGRCVLVHDARIQRGITGIMASRLQGFFKAPAIVIAEGEQTAVGSIRCNRENMIAEFFSRHAGDFLTYGGHDFAAGFSLESSRLSSFLDSFFSRIGEIELPAQGEEAIAIDAEIPIAHLTPDIVRTVDLFEPYGEGNKPLSFLTRGVKIVSCELIGRKELSHLKLLFEAGRTRWPAVFWNAAAKFPGEFTIGDTVDIVYRVGRNTYGGSENLQLTVLDLHK